MPFDRWRELGADGLVIGTVQKDGNGLKIQVRLFNVRSRQAVFAREYTGSAANPRVYAHTMADEIHKQQRALRGVARTKLTFSSDRDREKVTGTVENRDVKEIYIADYDGANQRRITVNRALNITPDLVARRPSRSPTRRTRGASRHCSSRSSTRARGTSRRRRGTQNWLPALSPDGTKIAFTSNRDGNPELYVMNRDGGGVRRLTNNPAIDTTPTWSPTGTQIAFTSDRSGSPADLRDGRRRAEPAARSRTDSYCDRATWSPAPFNEIAFAAAPGRATTSRSMTSPTGATRQITFGEGSNESPAYSPNGRHIAFTSTRAGKVQMFTVGRDGKDLRQITKTATTSRRTGRIERSAGLSD